MGIKTPKVQVQQGLFGSNSWQGKLAVDNRALNSLRLTWELWSRTHANTKMKNGIKLSWTIITPWYLRSRLKIKITHINMIEIEERSLPGAFWIGIKNKVAVCSPRRKVERRHMEGVGVHPGQPLKLPKHLRESLGSPLQGRILNSAWVNSSPWAQLLRHPNKHPPLIIPKYTASNSKSIKLALNLRKKLQNE